MATYSTFKRLEPYFQISVKCSNTLILRTFNNLGEGTFRLVGCSGVLVPVGINVRAKTQPNS